jgi:hypothetical protein
MSEDQDCACEERGHDLLERKTTGSKQDVTWYRHCTVHLPIMISKISKSLLIGVLWATVLGVAGRAHAQMGPTLAASDFTIYFEAFDGKQWVRMNSVQQQYFFNRARCQCDQDTNAELKVVIQPAAGTAQKITALLAANLAGGQGVGRLFASAYGIDCLAPNAVLGNLAGYCTNLLDPGNYPGLSFPMSVFGTANFWESPPIPVAYLFNSLQMPSCGSLGSCDSVSACNTTATQTNIQFWAQTNSGTSPDFDPGPSASVNLVGYAPYTPIIGAVEGGNEALTVSWSWTSGQNPATDTTLLGVQLFCQRDAGNQVFSNGAYGAAYVTSAMLCPTSTTAPTSGGSFSNLDPKYLCSTLIPATATSYRIKGLQNGIPYGVAVAAVDKYGNIGALSDVLYAVPMAGTGGNDGSVGDPVTGPRGSFAGGCSIAFGGRHARSECAGISWLAVASLAFALTSLRSRRSRRPHAPSL